MLRYCELLQTETMITWHMKQYTYWSSLVPVKIVHAYYMYIDVYSKWRDTDWFPSSFNAHPFLSYHVDYIFYLTVILRFMSFWEDCFGWAYDCSTTNNNCCFVLIFHKYNESTFLYLRVRLVLCIVFHIICLLHMAFYIEIHRTNITSVPSVLHNYIYQCSIQNLWL